MEPTVIVLLIANLMVIGGTLLRGVAVLVNVRDTLRDLLVKVGSKNPPEGLIGDVEALKIETRRHGGRLIVVESELGLKIQDRT